MYTDDDLIQLSALQHYVFCPRQCALMHIEQAWMENVLTAEGRVMHERAHEEQFEMRDGVRIERGMPIRSLVLGLSGKLDVVEFHKGDGGVWIPFPVEYKHGRPKRDMSDAVQLCAQALCLEEMMRVQVPAGAIFYGKTRRRHDVVLDDALRAKTKETAEKLHVFIAEAKTPPPAYAKRCESCSLIDVCKPKRFECSAPVEHYMRRMIYGPA